jgi:hypothetical protein
MFPQMGIFSSVRSQLRCYLKKDLCGMAGWAQVVEHLPSKHEASTLKNIRQDTAETPVHRCSSQHYSQ